MQVPREQIQQKLQKRWRPSADVSGSSDEELELSILVGANYYWKIVSDRETVKIPGCHRNYFELGSAESMKNLSEASDSSAF